jgi:hypothetical protein
LRDIQGRKSVRNYMKTYINCFISLKYQINGGLFSGAKLKVPIDKGAK